MPLNDAGSGGVSSRDEAKDAIRRLLKALNKWRKAPDEVHQSDGDVVRNDQKFEELDRIRDRVNELVDTYPGLRGYAKRLGFKGFDDDEAQQQGDESGGGGGKGGGGDGDGGNDGGNKPPGRGANWKIPGVKGEDWYVVRGPKGAQFAVQEWNLAGNQVQVAIRLPRNENELARYGVKKGEGKLLRGGELKRLEFIGHVDELVFHGEEKNWNKAIARNLIRSYRGTPVIENDEVMSVMIASAIFNWPEQAIKGALKQTDWYKRSTVYQRKYSVDYSPAQRRGVVADYHNRMTDALDDMYGFEWEKFVKPKDVMERARKIAAGEWGMTGDPDAGLRAWLSWENERAQQIEGTPAWMEREQLDEQSRAFMNRPEDMFEQLRTQALTYLGYGRGTQPLLDRDTLMRWSEDIVSERRSEGDWAQFLRKQAKSLHPYFNDELPWQDQAAPYKSVAESVLGTTIGWDDRVLRQIQGIDNNGAPTDRAMPLYAYEQMIRDTDPRFWRNPQTEEKTRAFAQEVMALMGGVG